MVRRPAAITHRASVPRPSARPTNRHGDDGKEAGRRHDQSGAQRVVAEQRLEQGGQRGAGSIQHRVGAEDDDAARDEIPFSQRPEIDHRARMAQFPEDQRRPGPRQTRISSVCTRQNGSPSQSHSWPLLSITSQQTMTITSSDRPTPSKLNGRFRNSMRCAVR